MTTVTLKGWSRGFDKVGMTQALRSLAGLSLAEAKAETDRFLEGQSLVVTLKDKAMASRFGTKAAELGANVDNISSSLSSHPTRN